MDGADALAMSQLQDPETEQAARWLNSDSGSASDDEKHGKRATSAAAATATTSAAPADERKRDAKAERDRREFVSKRKGPTVIEDHVSMPDRDEHSAAVFKEQLKPPANYPPSLTQIMFWDVSLCWRLFGGRDWEDLPLAAVPPKAKSAPSRSPATQPSAGNGGVFISLADALARDMPAMRPPLHLSPSLDENAFVDRSSALNYGLHAYGSGDDDQLARPIAVSGVGGSKKAAPNQGDPNIWGMLDADVGAFVCCLSHKS